MRVQKFGHLEGDGRHKAQQARPKPKGHTIAFTPGVKVPIERGICRLALPFFALCLPLMADTHFRANKSRGNAPPGRGHCDIRLQVDHEAEVTVQGDRVFIRTLSGRPSGDAGSECSEPMPGVRLQNFNFEVLDRRGEIVLVAQPSQRNRYTAVVRIRDGSGGAGRYQFRLSWRSAAYSPGHSMPQGPATIGLHDALLLCQKTALIEIVNRYRFGDAKIESIRQDRQPDRRDRIVGEASARRGQDQKYFHFACDVDFTSGEVRFINFGPREF